MLLLSTGHTNAYPVLYPEGYQLIVELRNLPGKKDKKVLIKCFHYKSAKRGAIIINIILKGLN